MAGELFTLEARPQRLMLEARPLDIRRREAVQQSGRSLCMSCYEFRPTLAFLDSSSVCIVCVAKRKAAQPIWDKLDEQAQEAIQQRSERAQRGVAKINYKRGGDFTLKRQR